MEAYSRIDPREPVHGLRRVYVSLRGLLVVTRPFINYEELRAKLAEAVKVRKWELFDEVLGEIITQLERRGLLIRAERLEMGEAD